MKTNGGHASNLHDHSSQSHSPIIFSLKYLFNSLLNVRIEHVAFIHSGNDFQIMTTHEMNRLFKSDRPFLFAPLAVVLDLAINRNSFSLFTQPRCKNTFFKEISILSASRINFSSFYSPCTFNVPWTILLNL